VNAPELCALAAGPPGATLELEPDESPEAALGDNVEFLDDKGSWLTLVTLASRDRTGACWLLRADDAALFGPTEVRWALPEAAPRRP
jgi:hypothetical protein